MYTPLHTHSTYSIGDALPFPKEYLDKCQELGIKSFAITEHGNMFSWLYYGKLQKDYPDIKLLYGVELYESFDMDIKDKSDSRFHLIAIAKNEEGRKALNHIVSESNTRGFYSKPRVDLKLLEPYADNLVILSACLASKIARESDYEKCKEYVLEYNRIFPYFFLEMQSHQTEEQEEYNKKILRLSEETDTPYVITTDAHVVNKEDLKYHGYFLQIARDTDAMNDAYEGCYLQSEEEIHAIMDKQIGKVNVDIGLQHTNVVSDLCDVVNMPFQEPRLPKFNTPEWYDSDLEYLSDLVEQGMSTRGILDKSEEEIKVYRDRIKYEMDTVENMGFAGYFLIVWEYINWAKNNGIMVGCGRGSAGGSLMLYLIGVTDIDPLVHDLIFDRFLNPERAGMPKQHWAFAVNPITQGCVN